MQNWLCGEEKRRGEHPTGSGGGRPRGRQDADGLRPGDLCPGKSALVRDLSGLAERVQDGAVDVGGRGQGGPEEGRRAQRRHPQRLLPGVRLPQPDVLP